MKFKNLALYLECSNSGTPKVGMVKQYLDYLSEMGYTQLYLGLTSGFEIESEPYFAYKRGRYTVSQLKEMDTYAKEKGIELIASIQTLAHLGFLKRHECYHGLFDSDNALLVGNEDAYKLIEKMINTISSALSSNTIHIGMDETIGLGEGRYKSIYGKEGDKKDLLLMQLDRVVKIANKYGYKHCEVWGDMLTGNGSCLSDEEIKKRIPSNVDVVIWRYTVKDENEIQALLDKGKNIANSLFYAGAAWKISGYAPSNRFSIARTIPQMKVCERNGIEKYIVTVWSDGYSSSSIFSILPTVYAVSEFNKGLWNGSGEIDKKKFENIVGIGFDDMMSLDYLNDPFFVQYDHFGNRSYWLLFGDILLNSYDVMVSRGTGEAYKRLAETFAKLSSGKFGYIYDMESSLAKVLSIKSEIGLDIRESYQTKNIDKLKVIIARMDLLICRFEDFIHSFCIYFRHEYSSIGIEVKTLMLGGILERFKYVKMLLLDFVNNGVKIDELEEKTLPPSIIPMPNEDRCHQADNRLLLTFNEL